ncbi:unnamed protein product, partial [Symbiodinium necroappetens]
MRLEDLVVKVEDARTPEEVIIKRQTAPLPQPAVARSDHFQKQVVDLMELVSRAPEPSEAHVMALGEASAAKRARQSALLRRQLAESTISSHGGKRHGPLEDSSPFQRLQRRDDVDMALGASMKTLTLPLPSQIE